jgi:hypothetical protein
MYEGWSIYGRTNTLISLQQPQKSSDQALNAIVSHYGAKSQKKKKKRERDQGKKKVPTKPANDSKPMINTYLEPPI